MSSGHHLEIQVHSGTSCVQFGKPRFSAAVYAEPPRNQKVILYSAYKLADRRECWAENRGGLLHEMFHLFGIMHTQMRSDRDQHITILRQNIQRSFSQEYDVSKAYILCYDKLFPLRYVMSAITMVFPMIATPSCIMVQRHSPQASGP